MMCLMTIVDTTLITCIDYILPDERWTFSEILIAESMKRQFAEYQVERTAQFLYSFHFDLSARRLDKYWTTVHADCLLLRLGESHFLCHERAILEYRLDK